jgi:hypothetical protein
MINKRLLRKIGGHEMSLVRLGTVVGLREKMRVHAGFDGPKVVKIIGAGRGSSWDLVSTIHDHWVGGESDQWRLSEGRIQSLI